MYDNWIDLGTYVSIASRLNLELEKNLLVWDYVEGMEYESYDGLYGGRIGITKNIKDNFKMLQEIIYYGYDENLLCESLYNELKLDNIEPVRDFDKTIFDGGVYTKEELICIQDMLTSPSGLEVQSSYVNTLLFDYDTVNRLNWISESDLIDTVKAFMIDLIIEDYSDNNITLVFTGDMNTLEEIRDNMISVLPEYEERYHKIYNYLKGENNWLN